MELYKQLRHTLEFTLLLSYCAGRMPFRLQHTLHAYRVQIRDVTILIRIYRGLFNNIEGNLWVAIAVPLAVDWGDAAGDVMLY